MKRTILKEIISFACAAVLLAAGSAPSKAESQTVKPGELAAEQIPYEYMVGTKLGGIVKTIQYPSKDYTGDGSEITKHALVYLPPEYSEENGYDLLVLCHGIGGDEREWGFMSAMSIGKNVVDHLILNGEIRPLIIVMPNGRSTAHYSDTSFNNAASFYTFGQEIRNDLLPYMDSHFATRASGHPDDPEFARMTRSMAGLSMGGMQTINIGLCECLDLFSAFGAFSAAPTSYPAAQIAARLENFPGEGIRFFYSICGTKDGTAYASASAAAKGLPDFTNRLGDTNFLWQELPGGHDFNIWNLGLYNFVRILDAVRYEAE